jgi:hypothetical protein
MSRAQTQAESLDGLTKEIAKTKAIRRVLKKLDDDTYKVPRRIREELGSMEVSVKTLSGKAAKKRKKAYKIVFPNVDERSELTELNPFTEMCAAYRERINRLEQELIDVKRSLDFLYDDGESLIYDGYLDRLSKMRTDTMRSTVIRTVLRPISDRLRIVDDLREMCTSQQWTIKAVMDSIRMIIDATHNGSPFNPDRGR